MTVRDDVRAAHTLDSNGWCRCGLMPQLTPERHEEHLEDVSGARDRGITLTLWQVSIMWFGGKQATFYLDAGVQGIRTHTEALQWIADNMPTHSRVSVMSITYTLENH